MIKREQDVSTRSVFKTAGFPNTPECVEELHKKRQRHPPEGENPNFYGQVISRTAALP